jgi:hypothetical protein
MNKLQFPWPQLIGIVLLYLLAAACDPCGDGGCTAAEERASHAR